MKGLTMLKGSAEISCLGKGRGDFSKFLAVCCKTEKTRNDHRKCWEERD